MPKFTRGIMASDIRNFGLAIKDELNKAIKAQDWDKFRQQAKRLKIARDQLAFLEKDCDYYSKHGYVQYAAMRRTLMLAANETAVVGAKLEDEIMPRAAQVADPEMAGEVVKELTTQMLILGRIEFNPPLRRTAPTQEEVQRSKDVLESVSNMKPSDQAGALGDAQLDALKKMIGG